MQRILLHKAVYITLFVALFVAVRLPFYSRAMYNEDGIFADIFINHPAGPAYGQIARINGKDVYTALRHPFAPYEIISGAGYLARPLVDFRGMTDGETTFGLRFIFSLFQLSMWLLLLGALCRRSQGWAFAPELALPLGCLAALAVTPLAIHNSIELQLDNTSGILMVGLMGFMFYQWQRRTMSPRALLVLAFLAAAFVGFGKNEWSFAFIATLLFGGFVLWLDGRWTRYAAENRRLHWQMLLLLLAGCLAGNVCSALYDWENYIGGVKLLSGLSHKVNVMKTGDLKGWWQLTARRLPYIYTLAVLLALLLCRLWNRVRSGDFAAFMGLVYPAVLTVAYAASYWNAEPRYFAPAFVGAVFAMAMYMPSLPGPRTRKLLVAVALLLALHSAWFLTVRLRLDPTYLTYQMPVWQIVLYTPGPPQPERPFWEVVEFAQWHKCVPILDIADCYNKPWIDYVGTSLGYDDGLRFVQPAGRTFCDDIPEFRRR